MGAAVELERACLAAWPGRVRAAMFGWSLQATDGYSQRANAAWPLGWDGSAPLDQAIGAVEQWFTGNGRATIFKLADGATQPPHLADALTARGYAPYMETRVMTASLQRRLGAGESARVSLHATAPEAFWAPMAEAAPSQADFAERRDIVSRIAGRCAFVVVEDEARPAAIGLGVLSGELVGLYLMRTAPWARRRGLARAATHAILAWGAEHGARLAYLQVEESNPGAIGLYERAGFTTAYRYRYWSTPAPGAASRSPPPAGR